MVKHRNAGDPSSNLGGPIYLSPYNFYFTKKRRKAMARKKLTRFEKARIIGARALQLSMGAKPMVDVTPDLDPIDIATMELKKNVLPLDVRTM
jgi:DNA-directed RNA polymerase subunit K